MSYYKTPSGHILNESGTIIVPDDNNPLWLEYVAFLSNNGTLESVNYEPQSVMQQKYIDAIKAKYEQYKADGQVAYEDFRARIVLKVRTGQLAQAQGVNIKRYLGPSYDEINTNGDWVTAHAFLSETVIPEADAFVEAYKAEALEIMSDYISKNFPQ